MKFAFLSAALFLAVGAQAATYHVSPRDLPGTPPDHLFRTISAAAAVVKAGDHVVIHAGVYRESVAVSASGTPQAPIVFEAAPMVSVTVSGADALQGLKREPGEPNIYSAAWPYRFIAWSSTRTHPDDDYHRLIGRAEQVMVSGYALRQVLSRDQLSRGSFFIDDAAGRLYLWGAGNEELIESTLPVEASVRDTIWNCTGAYVTVRGIRFRYAGNAAQHGAALFAGVGDRAENCVFERMNASGATFAAPDIAVSGCTFQDNGQLGFGANGSHRLHFTDCLVRNNNVKGFSRGWEAGGLKIVLSRDVVLERSQFLANRGTGIWFDIGNENPEVRNCLIADNEDAGIFCEISYGMRAHDNVICRNGLARSPGAWGAQAGICLSSSPGCDVERNLLLGNREGLDFREQTRTTPRIDAKRGAVEEPIWNHDERILHNVFAHNRDTQLGGWFDMSDERFLPARMQTPPKAGASHPASGAVATDTARPPLGRPTGLSLEKLNIRVDNNLYAVDTDEPLWWWGVPWKHQEAYTDLKRIRSTLSCESQGAEAPFSPADSLLGDLRIPPGSAAFRMKCYPVGTVPGVTLGALPKVR